MYHSWYLIMGGYTLRPNPGDNDFIEGSPDLILRGSGLSLLLDMDPPLVTPISEEQIRDYGKADSLAKLLACLQATYLVILCISRVSCHLPVSQLEINTCGHALCALAIYSFWFRKPKDVKTMTVITGPRAAQAAALLFALSEVDTMLDIEWLSDVCRVCEKVEDIPDFFDLSPELSDLELSECFASIARLNLVQESMSCNPNYPTESPHQDSLQPQFSRAHRPWGFIFRTLVNVERPNWLFEMSHLLKSRTKPLSTTRDQQ